MSKHSFVGQESQLLCDECRERVDHPSHRTSTRGPVHDPDPTPGFVDLVAEVERTPRCHAPNDDNSYMRCRRHSGHDGPHADVHEGTQYQWGEGDVDEPIDLKAEIDPRPLTPLIMRCQSHHPDIDDIQCKEEPDHVPPHFAIGPSGTRYHWGDSGTHATLVKQCGVLLTGPFELQFECDLPAGHEGQHHCRCGLSDPTGHLTCARQKGHTGRHAATRAGVAPKTWTNYDPEYQVNLTGDESAPTKSAVRSDDTIELVEEMAEAHQVPADVLDAKHTTGEAKQCDHGGVWREGKLWTCHLTLGHDGYHEGARYTPDGAVFYVWDESGGRAGPPVLHPEALMAGQDCSVVMRGTPYAGCSRPYGHAGPHASDEELVRTTREHLQAANDASRRLAGVEKCGNKLFGEQIFCSRPAGHAGNHRRAWDGQQHEWDDPAAIESPSHLEKDVLLAQDLFTSVELQTIAQRAEGIRDADGLHDGTELAADLLAGFATILDASLQHRHLEGQIDTLATFLLDEKGGPTCDESAVECAIRIIQGFDARVGEVRRTYHVWKLDPDNEAKEKTFWNRLGDLCESIKEPEAPDGILECGHHKSQLRTVVGLSGTYFNCMVCEDRAEKEAKRAAEEEKDDA